MTNEALQDIEIITPSCIIGIDRETQKLELNILDGYELDIDSDNLRVKVVKQKTAASYPYVIATALICLFIASV